MRPSGSSLSLRVFRSCFAKARKLALWWSGVLACPLPNSLVGGLLRFLSGCTWLCFFGVEIVMLGLVFGFVFLLFLGVFWGHCCYLCLRCAVVLFCCILVLNYLHMYVVLFVLMRPLVLWVHLHDSVVFFVGMVLV